MSIFTWDASVNNSYDDYTVFLLQISLILTEFSFTLFRNKSLEKHLNDVT